MRFRNPKTGDVYTVEALAIAWRRFCLERNDKWVKDNPHEAARLCTDYSAAYAEISAVRGITIVKCRDCVYGDWDSKPDDAMVCTHNGLSGWYSGDDFCSSGKEKKRAKENDTDN